METNQKRSLSPIPVFLEILMALCMFNAFIKWSDIHEWIGKILAIFIYFLILNGWISLRATEPFYKYETVLVDLGAIFGYFNIISSITSQELPIWGYKTSFFLYMSLICACYFVWDLIVSNINDALGDKSSAKSLRGWAKKMLFSAIIYLGEYILFLFIISSNLFNKEQSVYFAWILAFLGVLLFSIWLYIWNAPKVDAWKKGKLEL